MLPEVGPVLLSKHACAFWLNCYPYQVRKKLGIPDCYARIGSRDDACWLRSRVRPKFVDDEWIDDKDDGKTLWSLQELAKRVGVTPGVALKRLPLPVATLKN